MFSPKCILPEILYIQNISNCKQQNWRQFHCTLTKGYLFWANLKNVHWKLVFWSQDLCCLHLFSSLYNEQENVAMSNNESTIFLGPWKTQQSHTISWNPISDAPLFLFSVSSSGLVFQPSQFTSYHWTISFFQFQSKSSKICLWIREHSKYISLEIGIYYNY